jgi:type III secretion system YscQ/HrcQ family protein
MTELNYTDRFDELDIGDERLAQPGDFATDLFKAARAARTAATQRKKIELVTPASPSWAARLPQVTAEQARLSAVVPAITHVLSWQLVDVLREIIARHVYATSDRVTIEFAGLREIAQPGSDFSNELAQGVFVWLAIEPNASPLIVRLDSGFAVSIIGAMLGIEGAQIDSLRALSPIERAVLEFLFLRTVSELNHEIGEPLLRVEQISSQSPDWLHGTAEPHDTAEQAGVSAAPHALRAVFRVRVNTNTGFAQLYLSDEALDALSTWHRSALAQKSRLRFAPSLAEKVARFKQITPDIPLTLLIGHSEIASADLNQLECGDILIIQQALITWRNAAFAGNLRMRAGSGDQPIIFGTAGEPGTAGQPGAGDGETALMNLVINNVASEAASPALTRLRMQSESPIEETAEGAAALDGLLLTVHVELAARRISIDELARLRAGQILELGCQATDPVDLVVDGRRVARGELVDIDGKLAVRITRVAI